LAPGQLFVFRVELLALGQNFFLLHGERSVLREDGQDRGQPAWMFGIGDTGRW
jgi:hypothetical protein